MKTFKNPAIAGFSAKVAEELSLVEMEQISGGLSSTSAGPGECAPDGCDGEPCDHAAPGQPSQPGKLRCVQDVGCSCV